MIPRPEDVEWMKRKLREDADNSKSFIEDLEIIERARRLDLTEFANELEGDMLCDKK